MKSTRRLTAIILSVIMVLSVMPLTAFASDDIHETEDGFQYKLESAHAVITGYVGDEEIITVPLRVDNYTVLHIGESAFEGNENLYTVNISNGIESIGKNAFKDCKCLNFLTIPSSIKDLSVSFLDGCDNILEVDITYNVKANYSSLENIPVAFSIVNNDNIGWNTRNLSKVIRYTVTSPNASNYSSDSGFLYSKDKTTLHRVPSGNMPSFYQVPNVKAITAYAFSSCNNLTNVIIPSTVEQISKYAFINCDNLEDLTLNVNPKLVESPLDIDYSGIKDLITTIFIPSDAVFDAGAYEPLLDSAVRYEVDLSHPLYDTSDGSLYSENFETLLSVLPSRGFTTFNITAPTTGIGDFAFCDCKTLTNVNIYSTVTSIGDGAFYNCEKLKNINLPSGLKTIGESAFENNTLLTSVVIPDSVEHIGWWAFSGCSSLKSVVLPAQLDVINDGVFSYCYSFESVVIPDGVIKIKDYAFSNIEHLKEITIPFSVQKIADTAFCDTPLEKIYGYENSAAQVFALHNNIEFVSLGETECQHSRTLDIETDATCLEDGRVDTVCAVCGEVLDTRIIPALGHDWSEPEYSWSKDYSTATATRVCGNNENHIETETVETSSEVITQAIPEIGQLGVTEYTAEFENPAFEKQVKQVETDASIYTSADGLWKYQKLYDGSVLITSGTESRAYLGSQTVLSVPESIDGMTVSGIGDFALTNCTFITELTVPTGITTIGTSAFEGCNRLEKVTLHDNILEFGARVFANCSSLKTVSLPGRLEKMGEEVFLNCTSLEGMNVYCPFNSYTLPARTFSGCTSLNTVSLGAHACNVGEYAFENCTSLTEVNFPSTAYTQIGNYAFVGCSSLECLHFNYWLSVIGKQAFTNCKKLSDIYYFSSQENWNQISISSDNEALDNVRIHYNVTDKHEYTVSGYKPATCTEDGIIYMTCPCGYEKQETVPAPGHKWGDVVYEWDSDNLHVTATRVCQRDGDHVETETVRTSVVEIAATCEQDGRLIYTANFRNPAFSTQQKAVPSGVLAGHRWGNISYTWASDNSTVTAIRICQNDGSHVETETANVSFELVKPASATQTGLIIYTAEFENKDFGTVSRAVTIPKIDTSDIGFPDVHEGDWFYDAVNYVSERGIITGYGNGKFGPGDALQRQDFIVILARAAKADLSEYTGKACSLTDVAVNAYYAPAVIWAIENGIIKGYDNGKFGVGDPITREQVCTILYRYIGIDDSTVDLSLLDGFSDRGKVSPFAKAAVAWALETGIISGKNSSTLAPLVSASRAEIATIIMRMDKKNLFNS